MHLLNALVIAIAVALAAAAALPAALATAKRAGGGPGSPPAPPLPSSSSSGKGNWKLRLPQWPTRKSAPGSSGQQAGPVTAAQEAAIKAALAFLDNPPPEDVATAKELEKTLDDAGLDCKTKARCVQVPADYAKENIAKLRNLAQLYRRYTLSIEYAVDYPPLYLRYDIPDQAVVPLEWMVAQMDIWLLKIAHPSALSTSKFATMPGFIVQIDPDKELLLASPDSWIFRFRPLDGGDPAPHPGPSSFIAYWSVPHPYRLAMPGPVSKWEISRSSDLVNIDGKPSEDPEEFAAFLLNGDDPEPDRGLWAYVQLGQGCDYKTVMSWCNDEFVRPAKRTAWRDWVRAEATRNEEPLEG